MKNNSINSSIFNFPNQTNVYHGKVRDVYSIGEEYLVMIASDRISAFDHILPKGIPYKGQVLNKVATLFLDATRDIVPNWLIGVPDPNVARGARFIGAVRTRSGKLVTDNWQEHFAVRIDDSPLKS